MLWDMSCKLPERSRSIAALEEWQRTSIRYTTMVEISPTAIVLQPWEAKCVGHLCHICINYGTMGFMFRMFKYALTMEDAWKRHGSI